MSPDTLQMPMRADGRSLESLEKAFHHLTGAHLVFISRKLTKCDCEKIAMANPVCRLLCDRCTGCGAQLRRPLALPTHPRLQVHNIRCPVGLTISILAAPSHNGDQEFLCVGPVLVETKPRNRLVEDLARRVRPALSPSIRQLLATTVPLIPYDKWQAALLLLPYLAQGINSANRPAPSPPDSHARLSDCVARARRLITDRFRDELTLHQVAREVGTSPCHFSRQFHAQLGTSFREFLQTARVAELKRILLESNVTITTAIFNAGFQSISQANRVFRSVVGVSPSEFRVSAHR